MLTLVKRVMCTFKYKKYTVHVYFGRALMHTMYNKNVHTLYVEIYMLTVVISFPWPDWSGMSGKARLILKSLL